MKMGFFEIEEWEKNYLGKALAGYELVFSAHPLTAEAVSEVTDCDILSTFIYSFLE